MTIMHDEVVQAIRSRTSEVAELETVSFVWENYSHAPEDSSELRVEDYFLPIAEAPSTSGDDRLRAQHYFNVLVARGSGDVEPRRIASYLKNAYTPGFSINVGPLAVVVESSEIQGGRVYDETRYAFPVVVHVRVDAQRLQGV